MRKILTRHTVVQFSTLIFFFVASELFSENYFPISIGNKWIFHRRGNSETHIIQVLSMEQERGANRTHKRSKRVKNANRNMVVIHNAINFRSYFLSHKATGWHQSDLIQFKKRKDRKIRSTTYKYADDQLFIPKQLKLEKKWSTSGVRFHQKKAKDILISNYKILSVENVKVKAGHFRRVLRISEEMVNHRKGQKKNWLSYTWLAPNIGPVRLKTINHEIFELVEYHLALDSQIKKEKMPAKWAKIKAHRMPNSALYE